MFPAHATNVPYVQQMLPIRGANVPYDQQMFPIDMQQMFPVEQQMFPVCSKCHLLMQQMSH